MAMLVVKGVMGKRGTYLASGDRCLEELSTLTGGLAVHILHILWGHAGTSRVLVVTKYQHAYKVHLDDVANVLD